MNGPHTVEFWLADAPLDGAPLVLHEDPVDRLAAIHVALELFDLLGSAAHARHWPAAERRLAEIITCWGFLELGRRGHPVIVDAIGALPAPVALRVGRLVGELDAALRSPAGAA